MKVAHIIPDLGVKSGGPSRSVLNTVEGIRARKVDADILTYDCLDNPNIAEGNYIRTVPYTQRLPFAYNYHYKDLFRTKIYDIYHIHSIYSYPTYYAPSYAKAHKKPYIITPRGSLYEQTMQYSHVKKWLYIKCVLLSQLNHAAAIQATCEQEMLEIRKLGVRAPIAIIPNPINVPSVIPAPINHSKMRIGFLGRIHPKKKIDGLLKAWALAGFGQRQDVELVIIGECNPNDMEYLHSLYSLQNRFGITNINWAGAKFGQEKQQMIQTLSYLIMPSFSENFGMVVPEALICGVPVLASKYAPWRILEDQKCGWWIDITPESIADALVQLLDVSEASRVEMGRIGQKLVIENYTQSVIADKLILLYKWLLGIEKRPDFIYND